MPFSEKDLKELKSVNKALKIYSSYVQLKKQGKEWIGLCCLHSEKTPSFSLTDKDGSLLFYCHGCGKGGDIIEFLSRVDNISIQAAMEKGFSLIGWQAGKEKVNAVFSEPIASGKAYITFPLVSLHPAESSLPGASNAREWLNKRGLTLETAQKLHWGYVQSAKVIAPNHPWVDLGWMLFPTIKNNQVTCLKYRSLSGKRTEDGQSAILRKPGMATSLYGIENIEFGEDVFVVEGEMDVAAMMQAGFHVVAYPNATYTPTPEERRTILQANTIYLAGDMDTAGQAAMNKLWAELRDRTYRITWPEGCKDANDAYLMYPDKFVQLVDDLKQKAQEIPMPHIYDMRQTLLRADTTKPLDNPARLRFPWKSIDEWVSIVPGDVVGVSASETGMGKTNWVMNILLHNAINYGKVVVNYSGEIPSQQYARRIAAHLMRVDKDKLISEDFKKAAGKMNEARFYNGYKPGANHREVLELLVWAKKQLGADILVIDHLHFLTRSEKDEYKAQSEAMRAIKDLAVDYGVIPIVVGQPRKAMSNQRQREAVTQDIKGSEALPVGTGILTPEGFTAIENIKIGDKVIGSNGKSTKVLEVIPQGVKQSYKVTFSDGGEVECDDGHFWTVRTPNGKVRGYDWRVLTLNEIRKSLSWKADPSGYFHWKWQIPVVAPVHFGKRPNLPLSPYLVGSLIGDGGFRGDTPTFTTKDTESVDELQNLIPPKHYLSPCKDGKSWRISAERGTRNQVRKVLTDLGLWNHRAETKFIPEIYQFAGISDRLELLRGLLDTDGWVTGKTGGKVRYGTTSPQLMEDIVRLVRSLGGLATWSRYDAPDHGNFDNYVIRIWIPDVNPYKLSRKANKYKVGRKDWNRSIVNVEPTKEREMICLRVEAKDGCFVTEDYIVTHNSFGADCSQIFMLHRKRLPTSDANSSPVFEELTKVILDKSRESATQSTKLFFKGSECTFYDIGGSSESEQEDMV